MAMNITVPNAFKSFRGLNKAHHPPEPKPLVVLWRSLKGMTQDDATHMAAGVAYYAIASMVPLFLGLVALVGLSLNSVTVQEAFFNFATTNIPGSADVIADNVGSLVQLSNALGLGAVVFLIVLGRAVLAAVSRAINRAWGIRKDRSFFVAIPQQLMMTLMLGMLGLLSTSATSVIQLINNQAFTVLGRQPLLETGLTYFSLHLIPAAITALIFLLVYRYLPNRPMRWVYIWPGVAVATGLFEVAKVLFLWYLERWAVYDELYGPLASAMVFLIWSYLSALILIFGAKIISEFKRLYYPDDPDQFPQKPTYPLMDA